MEGFLFDGRSFTLSRQEGGSGAENSSMDPGCDRGAAYGPEHVGFACIFALDKPCIEVLELPDLKADGVSDRGCDGGYGVVTNGAFRTMSSGARLGLAVH